MSSARMPPPITNSRTEAAEPGALHEPLEVAHERVEDSNPASSVFSFWPELTLLGGGGERESGAAGEPGDALGHRVEAGPALRALGVGDRPGLSLGRSRVTEPFAAASMIEATKAFFSVRSVMM